jgi:hypothetical protein
MAVSVIGEGASGFPGGPGAGMREGGPAPKYMAPPNITGTGTGDTTKPKTTTQKIVPRYEFVILFIWREPIGPETPAVAAITDKKN